MNGWWILALVVLGTFAVDFVLAQFVRKLVDRSAVRLRRRR